MEQSSIPATITRISTTKDHGLKINIETQEIPFEEKAKLLSLADKYGYFFFAETEIREVDYSKLPKITLEDNEKSPSKRLRNVLFIYWQISVGNKKPFEEFYKETIEQYIDAVKEKLI